MDDEKLIRDVAGTMLKPLGYDAETAPDGATSIVLFTEARARGQGFDAVLMDLTVQEAWAG